MHDILPNEVVKQQIFRVKAERNFLEICESSNKLSDPGFDSRRNSHSSNF